MGIKNILGNFSDEFVELGKDTVRQTKTQVVKGMVVSAKKQITGSQQGGEKKTEPANSGDDNSGSEIFSQMMGGIKKMTPAQMQAARQNDQAQAQAKAAKIRQGLNQINQAIRQYRQKKSQELPAYISGQPGQGDNPVQQLEKIEKQKKEEEKTKKKKNLLPDSVKQFIGTGEKSKFSVG